MYSTINILLFLDSHLPVYYTISLTRLFGRVTITITGSVLSEFTPGHTPKRSALPPSIQGADNNFTAKVYTGGTIPLPAAVTFTHLTLQIKP
jgi:hypothetical protein